MTERRRWSSVRWYLCGDEYNSVMAENDSASVKSSVATTATQFNSVLAVADEESSSVGSSEATVTQPMPEDLSDKGNIGREATKEDVEVAKAGSAVSKTMSEEHAATIIQSAFRGFRVIRHCQITSIRSSCRKISFNSTEITSIQRSLVGFMLQFSFERTTSALVNVPTPAISAGLCYNLS